MTRRGAGADGPRACGDSCWRCPIQRLLALSIPGLDVTLGTLIEWTAARKGALKRG